MSLVRNRLAVAVIAAAGIASIASAQSADLAVTKTGPGIATANSDVAYTVTLFNAGPDTSLAATITDPVPVGMTFVSAGQNGTPTFGCSFNPLTGLNGTVTCVNDSFPASQTATFTFIFHIPTGTAAGTAFTNIVTASSATPDPNPDDDTGVTTTFVSPPPQADVAVTKSGPAGAAANTDVPFTITVTNTSTTNAATNVTLHDGLPGTMTFVSLTPSTGCTKPLPGNGGAIDCNIGSLPAGTTLTYQLVGHIPPGTATGTLFPNTATISASNDPNPDNDAASATVTVASADVSVTKTGPATVLAGSTITYTITVTNGGPDNADSVNLTDPLPPSTTFVSWAQNTGPIAVCGTPGVGTSGTVTCSFAILNNGASAQFTLVINAGNSTPITNTASVSTNTFDPNSANNSSSVTTTVTGADLSVVKTGPTSVAAGSNVTYTITVTNNGPSDAQSVGLSDTLPANTTNVSFAAPAGWNTTAPAPNFVGIVTATTASLPAFTSATFTLVVNVNGTTPVGTIITNTATVSSATNDPNSGNNSSTTTAPVATGNADLSITKTFAPNSPVLPRNFNVTYTITAMNLGPGIASGVQVTDTIPATMTFVSATPSQGSCSGTGPVICALGTLDSGASATVSVVARTTATLGPATNTATVSSAAVDPNPSNNTATATFTIVADIPTLSPFLLALMAAALAAFALLKLK